MSNFMSKYYFVNFKKPSLDCIIKMPSSATLLCSLTESGPYFSPATWPEEVCLIIGVLPPAQATSQRLQHTAQEYGT